MNGRPTFTVDQKTFVVHQLAARLQDNSGQRLTSALINGILNELLAALPTAAEPPAQAAPQPRPSPDRPAPEAVLGARRRTIKKGAANVS